MITPAAFEGSRGIRDQTTKVELTPLCECDRRDVVEAGLFGVGERANVAWEASDGDRCGGWSDSTGGGSGGGGGD